MTGSSSGSGLDGGYGLQRKIQTSETATNSALLPRRERRFVVRTQYRIVWALVVFLGLSSPPPSSATEQELEEGPAPASVEEMKGPIERPFLRIPRGAPVFPGLSRMIRSLPPFFADSRIEARYRTYYLRQGDVDAPATNEAWAMGGSAYLHSGWFADSFAVEVEGFTSQPIVAPSGKDGTLLLEPGQKGYSVLGIANGRLRWKGTELIGGRLSLEMPYINRNDNRMTPQTFEALQLERGEGPVRFSLGWVWNTKVRISKKFESMAEVAAPGSGKERGLGHLGLLWEPNERFQLGATGWVLPDLYSNLYAEIATSLDLTENVGLRVESQFTHQHSIGDELMPGPSFSAWNLGARASASWRGLVLRTGFSVTGKDRSILSPFGSNPSYVNLMQRNFNQREEKALLLSLSSDFSELGWSGASAILNFAAGWEGRSQSDGVRRDARELDLTLDFKEPTGFFQGLWIRLRGAWLDVENGPKNTTDFRVIFRYDFPII